MKVRIAVPLFAAALLLAATACGKSSNDITNNIKPITGTISVNSSPPPTAVYFQPVSNGDPATLDVMFNSGGSMVAMDGFTLEIQFDQGVVQIGGELANGSLTATPVGDCNTCLESCLDGTTSTTYTCQTCTFCGTTNDFTPIATGTSPLCAVNANANTSGTLLVGVNRTPDFTKVGCTITNVQTPVRLLRLFLFPASTGTSRITLVQKPAGQNGGCAILGPGATDLGIPCFDGGATFTAAR